jgi:hypothetical protein
MLNRCRFFLIAAAVVSIGVLLAVEAASAQPMTKHYYWGKNGKCFWSWTPNAPHCYPPAMGFGVVNASFCAGLPRCHAKPVDVGGTKRSGVFPGGFGDRGPRQGRDFPRR